jgi:hypothetical protein
MRRQPTGGLPLRAVVNPLVVCAKLESKRQHMVLFDSQRATEFGILRKYLYRFINDDEDYRARISTGC